MRSFVNILLLLLFPVSAWCQRADSVSQALDTLKRNKYLPTGIRIGADIIGPIKSKYQNDFSGWEVAADVDFDRYFLVAEYGNWSRTFNSDSGAYWNSGNYWRIGADVNFLVKDPDRNMFFLGFRYGKSTFSETLYITSVDPVWGTLNSQYRNDDVRSHWLELTTGLRVKMWKIFWMGYTARFKFGLKNSDTPEMLPHDVPGFGRTDRETYWGFNYYLMVRIPLRKAPVIPVVKKK